MKKGLLIIVAIVLIFALTGFGSYNRLVAIDEGVNGKWSQVENQLQGEPINPNLVNELAMVRKSYLTLRGPPN